MEKAGDEEEQGVLLGALFNNGVTLLDRKELAVVAEEAAVVVLEAGENAKGGNLRAI